MNVKRELFKLLDALPAQEISGWRLYELMLMRTKRHTYPQTLLNYAREYADIAGAEFKCVDYERSIYQYKPNLKIAGAIISGKE